MILCGSEDVIWGRRFEGLIPYLERLFNQAENDYLKEEISKFMSVLPCPECNGARLKKESLSIRINEKNIWQVTQMSIKEAKEFFGSLNLSDEKKTISHQVLKEIVRRLGFCADVGLDYLTLDRKSSTLSGGEAERIRLASQVGSGLVGVVYILDEPSIGLHQRDNAKLLSTLIALRDLGNTLIVVEHDEATIRAADHIIDLGPGAGRHGGKVICSGTFSEILQSRDSLTGKYLRGDLKIQIPQRRNYKDKKNIKIIGCAEHNLKNIDVSIPLGVLSALQEFPVQANQLWLMKFFIGLWQKKSTSQRSIRESTKK
jgi:Excinuclease ABC subunit A